MLDGLTVEDAERVYEAIRLANPGGLGDAPEQDVRDEPTVTLLEAMKLAADRDLIARQYANGFADVFDFGVPAFLDGVRAVRLRRGGDHRLATPLARRVPGQLIARKNGPAVAEDVQPRAAEVLRLGGHRHPRGPARPGSHSTGTCGPTATSSTPAPPPT